MGQMQSFNAPMLSRNPLLHYVFAHMGLAEERGLGIKTLKADAEKHGLPLPRYVWAAPYLSLMLYRSRAGAERTLDARILASLSKAERTGWQWLSTRDAVTSSEYAAAMRVPERTALNHLKRFTDLRLLRRYGSGPSTKYKVLSP
jgi:ATP-dependent DNA helicase RecG